MRDFFPENVGARFVGEPNKPIFPGDGELLRASARAHHLAADRSRRLLHPRVSRWFPPIATCRTPNPGGSFPRGRVRGRSPWARRSWLPLATASYFYPAATATWMSSGFLRLRLMKKERRRAPPMRRRRPIRHRRPWLAGFARRRHASICSAGQCLAFRREWRRPMEPTLPVFSDGSHG